MARYINDEVEAFLTTILHDLIYLQLVSLDAEGKLNSTGITTLGELKLGLYGEEYTYQKIDKDIKKLSELLRNNDVNKKKEE